MASLWEFERYCKTGQLPDRLAYELQQDKYIEKLVLQEYGKERRYWSRIDSLASKALLFVCEPDGLVDCFATRANELETACGWEEKGIAYSKIIDGWENLPHGGRMRARCASG